MKKLKWLKVLCDGFVITAVIILMILPVVILYLDIQDGKVTIPGVIFCIMAFLFFAYGLFTTIYGIIHPEQVDEIGQQRKIEERINKPIWKLVVDFIIASVGMGLFSYIIDLAVKRNTEPITYYAILGFLLGVVVYAVLIGYHLYYKNKNKNSE